MKLEAPKTKHPIILTIDCLDVPFTATVQEAADGFMEIVDLVLEGTTNTHVIALLFDTNINIQAYDQIENIYKETK
jgi:hypothetical protein